MASRWGFCKVRNISRDEPAESLEVRDDMRRNRTAAKDWAYACQSESPPAVREREDSSYGRGVGHLNLLNQTHEQHVGLGLSPFCRETLLGLTSNVVIGCLETLQQLAQGAVRVCWEDRHGVCFVEGGGGFRRRRESAALIGSLVDNEKALPDAEEVLCAAVIRCIQQAPKKAGLGTGAKRR